MGIITATSEAARCTDHVVIRGQTRCAAGGTLPPSTLLQVMLGLRFASFRMTSKTSGRCGRLSSITSRASHQCDYPGLSQATLLLAYYYEQYLHLYSMYLHVSTSYL